MHRILLAIGGLLVGLLAALFIAPAFIDWNRYRGVLEEEATRLLGREVRVGGRIGIKFLPTPSLSVQQIRLADTQAHVGEPLFRAEAVTVGLAIGPLFRGEVQVTHVQMHKPVLTLVLDGKGGGNWSTLADRKLQAVLAPSRVALDDVRFSDGAIAVLESDGTERTRLDRIAGQLSAADLEGPYRIAATFDYRGHAGELKLGTAPADADGTVRLKGSVTLPQSQLAMTLDGAARNVLTQPLLEGLVKARFGENPKSDSAIGRETAFEIGGTLTADTSGALLRALMISFERAGRPQLVSGEGRMVWGARPSLDLTLTSQWVDLDSIAPAAADKSLAERVQAMTLALLAALPDQGTTSVRLGLDQATLRGEIVGAVGLVVTRDAGSSAFTLSALLPGGSRVHLAGGLVPDEGRSRFSGRLSLGGASVRRFLAWAMASEAPGLGTDGAFHVDGNVSLQQGRYAIDGMTARLAGSDFGGSVAFSDDAGRRKLDVSLAGGELDLDAVLAEKPTITDLRTRLFESIAAVPAKRAFDAVALRLDFGMLHVGGLALGDMQATLDIADGKLSVSRLSAQGAEGWSLDAKADLVRGARNMPHGTSAFTVSASTPAGLASLMRIAGLVPPWQPSAVHSGHALPLHLSGRVRLDAAETMQATVSLDGTLGRGRIAANVRMTPGEASWRDWPTDLAVTLTGRDSAALADLLSARSRRAAPDAADPASIVLRGIGTPGGGLETLLAAEIIGNAMEYRGRIAMTDTAEIVADGRLHVALTDAGRMLAALGLPFEGPLARRALEGELRLTRKPGNLRLESGALSLAGSPARVALELAANGEGATLAGSVATGTASLPALLGALTDAKTRRSGSTREAVIWSDAPFDFTGLADHAVELEVEAASFDIGGGVLISAPKARVAAKAGRVTLALTSAKALDGAVKGEIRLTEVPAGAAAEIDISVQGARIEALFPEVKDAAASGAVSTSVRLSGQALSPRGVIGALRGTGQVDLGAGQIHRLTPDAIAQATEAVLAKAGELSPEDIRGRLLAALAQGTMPIPRDRLAIDVTDGVIRLAPLQLEAGAGRTTGNWTIDLESMRYDAEWRIESMPKPTGEGRSSQPLPAIVVVYTGPLSEITRAVPRLQSDDFEREVVVRKMERDLAELERLRKLDEELARREIERRRQLEIERQHRMEEERLRLERERAGAQQPIEVRPGQTPSSQGDGGRTELAPSVPGPALAPSLPASPDAVPGVNSQAAANETATVVPRQSPPAAARPRPDARPPLKQRSRYFNDQDRANP